MLHTRQSTGRDPLLSGHVEKNLAPDLPPLTPPNWVPKFPYVQELSNDVCDEGVINTVAGFWASFVQKKQQHCLFYSEEKSSFLF